VVMSMAYILSGRLKNFQERLIPQKGKCSRVSVLG
jgi:hypothetical protein